jgi:hypothetical protein
MAEFYVVGTHPWAASALFSVVPPGPPPLHLRLLTRGDDADAPRPRRCHSRDSRGVGVVARARDGQDAAVACVPPCLVGDITPDAVYRTIRSGDDREDAYPTGVHGSAAAGYIMLFPSVTAAKNGAQADAGSGGILGGGRLRLRRRGMRP